jgi:hypothetical protein
MSDGTNPVNPVYSASYNELLSDVFGELEGKFAALASPTLSKQETVTALYSSIAESVGDKNRRPGIPWKRLFQFIPRILLMFSRITYGAITNRVKHIPDNAVVFRSWLVPRSFSGTDLVDDYFRQLPVELSNSENVFVTFSSVNVGLIRRFAGSKKPSNFVYAYGLLGLLDIFALFFDYLVTGLVQARKTYFLNGEDVTDFINHSLLLDYLELRSLEAYSEKYKCKKLAGHRIKAFVYVFENQSWEKICCEYLRRHDIKLIGYQSSGFSPLFLNFYPTEKDAKQQPMPDILLTVGDHFRRYLKENGHFEVPIETFAAMRFSYPSRDGNYIVCAPHKEILGRVLYAFAVHISQYPGIIKDLIEVFGDSDIQVDLKVHPIYRQEDLNRLPGLPGNFKVVTEVLIESLNETYDCVLFNDNSFGIEAILKGVKSFQYSRDGSFVDNRYMYFGLWKVNFQLPDIFDLKDSLQSGNFDKSFDVENVSRYINKMYKPYTANEFDYFRCLLNAA